MNKLKAFAKNNIDTYTITLIGVLLLAAFLPVRGLGYEIGSFLSKAAVALLFFLHGVKLSPQNLWAGLTHWRLHLAITTCTFIMFPILGLLLKPVLWPLMGETLYWGLLFVCALPSTVQASIAFTSMAKGNVAAAVCSASGSSLLGVVVTPLLVGLLLHTTVGGFSGRAVLDLFYQLVLPFAAGQLMRFKLAGWVGTHKKVVGYVDRLSVLFIVYVTFSHGTTEGLWSTLNVPLFLRLTLGCALLLAIALVITWQAGRKLGFNRGDRVVLLFCGSKKSLVTGVPMANIIFPASLASTIILPLMVFHQLQLMTCAYLARRLGARAEAEKHE